MHVVQRSPGDAAITVGGDTGASRTVDPVNVMDCRRCVMRSRESVRTAGSTPLDRTATGHLHFIPHQSDFRECIVNVLVVTAHPCC